MADRDSTLLAPAAPNTSRYSLMGVDLLSIHKTKVLDSFFIEYPSSTEHGNSADDLLDPPIQITVLRADKDKMYLGIYVPPSLELTKAAKPNACWRQSWSKVADTLNASPESAQNASCLQLQEPSSLAETSLDAAEINAHDELAALAEARYFFYQMIDALFDSEDTRLSMDWPLAKAGLSQWQEWLLRREHRVRHLLNNQSDSTGGEQ